MAGLNPLAEIKALESKTPTSDPENCTSEKSPARLSFNPHLAMKTGRIGPMKQMTIPLTTKPAQSRPKITLCAEGETFSKICLFEDIMAFCLRLTLRAMRHQPRARNSEAAQND
jgi:hypothetical protein